MADLVKKQDIKINVGRLSMLLNCPIIETSALKQTGLEELIDKAINVALKEKLMIYLKSFSKKLERRLMK